MNILHTIVDFFIPTAHAVGSWSKYCESLGICSNGESFFIIFAERITMMIFSIIGGASVVVIIYGSIRIIASYGDSQGLDAGKKAIFTAVIGLIFAVVGAALVQFVVDTLSSAIS